MDEPRAVQTLSLDDSEGFWTDTVPAYPPAKPEHLNLIEIPKPASVPAISVSEAGVDMPGVGHLRAAGLSCEVAVFEKLTPAPKVTGVVAALANGMRKESIARAETAVLRGRPLHDAGSFPETLRRELDHEQREGLLIQLMFAARRLADHSISRRLPWAADVCPECGALADRLSEKMQHRRGCRIGDVASAIDRLEYHQLKSQTKEEVSSWDTAAAGEGIRTSGWKHRGCLSCGERDGEWEGHYRDGSVNLPLLGLNQCVGPGMDGIGHTLYTHRCGSGKDGVR